MDNTPTTLLPLPSRAITALTNANLNTTDDIQNYITQHGTIRKVIGIGPAYADLINKILTPTITTIPAHLQTILNTLPNNPSLTIPPGIYKLTEPAILPKLPGESPCHIRGYGARISGGDFPSIIRPDQGERDSCTGWKIEGLDFTYGKCAMEIHQTRQLIIDRCNVRGMDSGHNLSFCLLATVQNCRLTTNKLGIRIGHGTSTTGTLSNCSTLNHNRFFGQGDQLLIDSCSSTVINQCTFEGSKANRCIAWDGHRSMVTKNLMIKNCYWEVSGGPLIAAIWLENLESPTIVIDQPEAHPGGVGNNWIFLHAHNNTNAMCDIRNPACLFGKFDTVKPYHSGIRHLYITHPQYSISEGNNNQLGLEDPNRWIGGQVGAIFRR